MPGTSNYSRNHTTSTAESSPTSEDPELQELDKRLKHITDTILPATPYILKLHSERPFNLNPHQAADLIRYTPFDAGEEQLQYLSFSATNWDDSLITPVGGWEGDRPDETSNSPHSQKMLSTSGTPKTAAKKISITEYRKRTAGQSSVNGASGPKDQTKSEKTTREERGSFGSQSSIAPTQGKKGLKRSAEDLRAEDAKNTQKSLEPQPLKKPRTSLEPPTVQKSKGTSSSSKLSLPGPISPTLPPLFEKRLAELDNAKKEEPEPSSRASGVAISVDSKSKKPAEKIGSEKPKESGGASQKPCKDSKAIDGKRVELEGTGKPLSNGVTKSATGREAKGNSAEPTASRSGLTRVKPSSQATEIQSHSEQKQRESKLLKLKIPRALRKSVSRILQLKPKSESSLKGRAAESSKRVPSKPLDRDARPASSKDRDGAGLKEGDGRQRERARSTTIDLNSRASEKRHRQDIDPDPSQSQSKRQKHRESKSPSAFRSPVLANRGGLKKPRDITPSTSVREEAVSTPQGLIRNGTPAAPNSVERSGKDTRHTPSASSSSYSTSIEAHDALKHEQAKYFELGKSLKKESDRIYKADRDPIPPSPVMKKYLAIRLEITLAFMLAYVVGDEMRRIERAPLRFEATWATLFQWIQKLQEQTTEYKYLRGLSLQLEAIIHMVAWNIESEHAASVGFEKPESAKALKRRYDEVQRMLIEGSALLSVDDLQVEFPRTWRAKARAPLAHSPSRLTSAGLGGDFYLPITGITLPIEAVRAGRSLLGEWCKMEGVEWTPRLNF